MVVLQINATYGLGSTGRNVLEMDCYLNKKGHKSYVAYGILTTEKEKKNIFSVGNLLDHKIHALLMRMTGKQGFYSKVATRKLCEKIEKITPDIVHLHNLHSNYICLPDLLEFLADKDYPVMITLHDCWFYTGRCYHYYGNKCYNWKDGCEDCLLHKCWQKTCIEKNMLHMKNTQLNRLSRLGIVGVSDWITGEAKESILKNSFFVKRIYNWIDHDIFKPVDVKKMKKKMHIEQQKVVLGISQGWSASKGLNEMIEIAEELKEQAVVILVGEIKKNNLPSNILSIGFVKDVEMLAKYYSLADVFVNPSKMETFGKVTAEAMACGTPVVVYDNTGAKELVGEGCGLVANNNDSKDMIRCVKEILNNGKHMYTANCVAYTKNEFDMQCQLKKYCELYQELLD